MLACGFAVQAQTQAQKDLERVKFVRDSVIKALDERREQYATSKNARKELTPIIESMEKRIAQLQAEYDKLVATISALECHSVIVAYEEAAKAAEKAKAAKAAKAAEATQEVQATTQQKAEAATASNKPSVVDDGEPKRDLVKNSYFFTRLSPSEYQTLLNARKREVELKELIAGYLEEYAALLALQSKYMEATTKKAAEDIAAQFETKNSNLEKLNAQIASEWSQIYDKKIYSYDLLMERYGNEEMLKFSTDATANANREIEESAGKYQSDALVNYFVRGKMIAEFEMKIATQQLLTPSCDSLNMVLTELRNKDYRLAKLSLPRRNFIRYENIVVKTTSIYSSTNPVPQTKVEDYGTVYRVRIGSSTGKMSIPQLRGVVPVSYTYLDGEYAYFAGSFRTEQEAEKGVSQLKRIGFTAPVIAVWVDGKYYPTLETLRQSESVCKIEISGIDILPEDVKSVIYKHKGDCTISRIGASFVVGTFDGKSVAEAVIAELKKVNAEMQVKIIK